MTKDTKTDLLDLAEVAARNRGFDGFSYADLAQAQGIRKASIHYHFPVKADLSQALMTRYQSRLETHLQHIDEAHPTGAARLSALVALYRSALNDGRTLCLCIAFTSSRESLSNEVRDQILEFRKMMVTWIEQVVRLGATDGTLSQTPAPRAEAQGILARLEGAHLAARAQEDVTLFDAATQTLLASPSQ